MKILVIGGGGREHALCWAIAASPLTDKLYCAPGNAGIADVAECVPITAMDFNRLIAFAQEKAIDFVVIGPDDPIAGGLADRFAEAGIKAFGPSKAASELEWSKGFTKDFCADENIPTGRYRRFRNADDAKAYAADHPLPVVVKADGLALGKGVVIAATRAEASAAIDGMFAGSFGKGGHEVVIEEFLEGEEVSYFVLSDGETVLPFGSAQDHKRVGDGDMGPNTGGMGAYSPAAALTPYLENQVLDQIVRPTIRGMAKRGRPFKGALFAGLMLTKDGPKLIEYNARFGDPETQVLMVRLKSDIVPLLLAAADGALKTVDARWHEHTALTVVMAARGYPEKPEKGTEIKRLDKAAQLDGVQVFHAGTARRQDGALIANGGRVLNVTAIGRTVADAQARAYRAVDEIDWPGGFCRRDIGWRAVAKEHKH
ncbi:MAG: phosphoribosylamine--glycine ligase [Alphaproteobacteria bacterium]|nr:phosphoribosylamine--glycine ligase [Alphaproteobacteria bacterium]